MIDLFIFNQGEGSESDLLTSGSNETRNTVFLSQLFLLFRPLLLLLLLSLRVVLSVFLIAPVISLWNLFSFIASPSFHSPSVSAFSLLLFFFPSSTLSLSLFLHLLPSDLFSIFFHFPVSADFIALTCFSVCSAETN